MKYVNSHFCLTSTFGMLEVIQINQAINKVNSTNQQMAQQWKGQVFQSYLDQYQQLEGSVKKMEELLVNINQQLNKYADTVAQRDQQDAQSFGF